MNLKIQILVDNNKSWIIPYVNFFIDKLSARGVSCNLVNDHNKIVKGDILILLSCEKIFKNLKLNKYNLVIHESDLPHGKGWSPLTYQVLEGKNKIPITIFEASKKIDSGKYYIRIVFDENENQKYDSGNFLLRIDPEKVIYYPDEIDVRAGWDLVQEFILQ